MIETKNKIKVELPKNFDTFAIESTKVKRFVTDVKKKPYMYIESDYSTSDTGQILTRIEAFLEMI